MTGFYTLGKFENVLLRARDLKTNPGYYKFKITNILEVTGDPDSSDIELEYIDTQTLPALSVFINPQKNGAILIKPRWKPDNSYERLIHSKVLSKIISEKKPLNHSTGGGNGIQTIVPEMLSDLSVKERKSINNVENIIGLFPGGDDYQSSIRYTATSTDLDKFEKDVEHDKRVYHPAGFCCMRSTYPSYKNQTQGEYDQSDSTQYLSNYFCHVCRYIIVDAIDPMKHPIIDLEYQAIYPRI